MKGASLFLKTIISQLSSITKSKSLAIKSKVESLKARVIVFSLLKHKKLPLAGSISRKVHALLLGSKEDQDNNDKANELQLVLHEANSLGNNDKVDELQLVLYEANSLGDEEDDDRYPDLRHSLFDEEDPNASVIDLVKNAKEDEGEDFRLEDEIDHVADLFIRKFHKRIRLQKLESFKRYQDMLERGS